MPSKKNLPKSSRAARDSQSQKATEPRPGRITVCLKPEVRKAVEGQARKGKDPTSTWIKKLVERAIEGDLYDRDGNQVVAAA